MKLLIPILLISLFTNANLYAQRFDDVEIKTEQLSETIYMLTGAGGNIGLCVGDDGVFMIDDQYAPLSEKIKAAVTKITDQPIQFVINTHWHGDHTGGNEHFGTTGSIIIAHENVRKRMSTEQLMQAFGRTVPASSVAALPVITFDEGINFYLNGEDIIATHTHNAHTDGDTFIYFPKSNVIHMGDTYFKDRYPFIDVSSGGSIDGIIETANRVLFLANTETKIIPGHGTISNKEELTQYRDVLMIIRDRVKKAYQLGKTIEEMQVMGLTSEFDAEWGAGFIKPAKLIDILYTDFSRGKQ